MSITCRAEDGGQRHGRFWREGRSHWSVGGRGPIPMVITIDIETVAVQGVGAQQGDTTSQLTQLLVQHFSVQPGAHRVRVVGADGVHSSCCPVLLSPEQGQSAARVQWANAGVLEQRTKQVVQGLLSGVELCRAWMPHIWGVAHVGDGKIEGKRRWGWAHI